MVRGSGVAWELLPPFQGKDRGGDGVVDLIRAAHGSSHFIEPERSLRGRVRDSQISMCPHPYPALPLKGRECTRERGFTSLVLFAKGDKLLRQSTLGMIVVATEGDPIPLNGSSVHGS